LYIGFIKIKDIRRGIEYISLKEAAVDRWER
jgi:hypothetical protein